MITNIDKEPREYLNELLLYANSMIEASDNKGYENLEESPELSNTWYNVSEKFQALIANIKMVEKLPDVEIPDLIETLEDTLEECKIAYKKVESGEVEEVNKKSKNEDKSKELKVNGLSAKINALPNRATMAKKGIKGNQSISKANKTKLTSFCQQMIDLKEDMLHNDGNALIKWMELFNKLLDFIQNLSEIKPGEYMALIQLRVIDSVGDIASIVDGGEICNEELPQRILEQLK
ncbi:hypothetical protein [Tenacibaculum sp. C7A-26P2]|uniref:hypothetical protein n=1 Tax=Tenacibaculum sp. C7A-26P2 TaxID=3447504 RepID=UPI003F85E007